MVTTAGKSEKTLAVNIDPDFFDEISEYLEVLGNPQRLKILKSIEHESKDIRTIAGEIGTTYENTKKHLYRLLATGLVRKEAGFGTPTPKGVYPVWKYSLAPGAMEIIIRDLGVFSTVAGAISDATVRRRLDDLRGEIARSLDTADAALLIVSGPKDGVIYPLTGDRTAIGREDSSGTEHRNHELVLPSEYSSVTRISKPHACVYRKGGEWHIEDCGSSGGTTVNGSALAPERAVAIRSGDVIELGRGPHAALLTIVILPRE